MKILKIIYPSTKGIKRSPQPASINGSTTYILIFLKMRYERIELSSQLWKSHIMSHYTNTAKLVAGAGIEPAIFSL